MVGVQRIKRKIFAQAAFLTIHGSDTIRSVSAASTNDAGYPFIQIVEGTIMAWNHGRQLWVPMAKDAVAASTSSSNKFKVADAGPFTQGSFVNINGVFRQISEINYDTEEITVDGDALSLTAGDSVSVESYRGVTTVDTSTGATTSLVVKDASGFKAGDVITIGTNADVDVSAVDYANETLTIASTTVAPGDVVYTQNEDSAYFKIACETVSTADLAKGYNASNVLVPCRTHGRVRERVLIGLVPEAKVYLKDNGIAFDNTAY